MTSVLRRAAAAALVLGLAVALNLSGAKEKKEPSIKDIMTKAHKGGDSLIFTIRKDLKEDEPDWKEVQKDSKELVRLGTSLGKATPPQGEKASWEKLTKAYLVSAKDLQAAADKKDKD